MSHSPTQNSAFLMLKSLRQNFPSSQKYEAVGQGIPVDDDDLEGSGEFREYVTSPLTGATPSGKPGFWRSFSFTDKIKSAKRLSTGL